jgi:hypothetical protein
MRRQQIQKAEEGEEKEGKEEKEEDKNHSKLDMILLRTLHVTPVPRMGLDIISMTCAERSIGSTIETLPRVTSHTWPRKSRQASSPRIEMTFTVTASQNRGMEITERKQK